MRKLRKDDEVIVLAGKDKGRRGRILKMVADGKKAVVDNINQVKKTQRPNPEKGVEGGIITIEAPIAISNLAIYNSASDKADRVGFKALDDGRKVRYFKSNGEVIDVE